MTLGIICEYNPFHLGHQYQLKQAQKQTNATTTIAIMSGDFTQRGEPAIINKYYRTQMALSQGIDLVLQLPTTFSLASAGYFCKGAVLSLNQCGINYLAFGSEKNNLTNLTNLAQILAFEPDEYKLLLKDYLKQGLSYPNAQQQALISYTQQNPNTSQNPNDLLALGYLSTIYKYNLAITPISIKRQGSHYGSHIGYPSASQIRTLILNNQPFSHTMPKTTAQILTNALANGYTPTTLNNFEPQILALLRRATLSELQNLPDVDIPLANRMYKFAQTSCTIDEFLTNCKTKAYTNTRLKRTLSHLLLNLTKDDMLQEPQYLRVLGFNQKGKEHLAKIKKTSQIPIITTTSKASKILSAQALHSFNIDIKASNIYALSQNCKSTLNEFSHFPIIHEI